MDKDASKATEKRLTSDRRKAQDSYPGEERRKGDRRQPKTPSAA